MFLTVLFFCSWPCMMSVGACFLIWLSWAQHSSCEQRSPTHFQTLCFRQRLMPRYNINNDFLNCESCRAGTYGVRNECNRSPLIKRTQANKKQPSNPRRPTAHTHTHIHKHLIFDILVCTFCQHPLITPKKEALCPLYSL